MVKIHCLALTLHQHSTHELRAIGDLHVLQLAALYPALTLSWSPHPLHVCNLLHPAGVIFLNSPLAVVINKNKTDRLLW